MREAPQISRKRLAAESQTSADLDPQDWREIVDFTRLKALGAKDIVCKHCLLQIVEIVRECLLCDRKSIPAA